MCYFYILAFALADAAFFFSPPFFPLSLLQIKNNLALTISTCTDTMPHLFKQLTLGNYIKLKQKYTQKGKGIIQFNIVDFMT